MGSSKEITTKNADPGFEDPNSSTEKRAQGQSSEAKDHGSRLSHEANDTQAKGATKTAPQNPYLELKPLERIVALEKDGKLSQEESYRQQRELYTRALNKADTTINYGGLHKDMQGLIDQLIKIEQNKAPGNEKQQENLKRQIGYGASLDVASDYFRFRLAWLEKSRADQLYGAFTDFGSKEFMKPEVIKEVFSHRAKAEELLDKSEKPSHAYDPNILNYLQKYHAQDLCMPYYVRGLVDSQRALYSAEKVFREVELGLCSYAVGVGLARPIVATGAWLTETLGLARLGTMAAPVLANLTRFAAPVMSKVAQVPGMTKVGIPVAKFAAGTFAPIGTASGATTMVTYANGKALLEGRDVQAKDYIESLQWAPSAAFAATGYQVSKSVAGKILEKNIVKIQETVASSLSGGKLIAPLAKEAAEEAGSTIALRVKEKAAQIFIQPFKNAFNSVADMIAHHDEILTNIGTYLQESAKNQNWLKANDSFKHAEKYLDDLAKMQKEEQAFLKTIGAKSSEELTFLNQQMQLVRKQIDDARASWLISSGVMNGVSLSLPLHLADRKAGMVDERSNPSGEFSQQVVVNQVENLSLFPMLRIGSGIGLVGRGVVATAVPKVITYDDMGHRLGKDQLGITKAQADAISDQGVFLSESINNSRAERQVPALLGFYAPNLVSKVPILKFALPAARFYSNSILPISIFAMPAMTHLEKYDALMSNYRAYVGTKFNYTDGFGTFKMTRPIGSEYLVPDSMLTPKQIQGLKDAEEAKAKEESKKKTTQRKAQ